MRYKFADRNTYVQACNWLAGTPVEFKAKNGEIEVIGGEVPEDFTEHFKFYKVKEVKATPLEEMQFLYDYSAVITRWHDNKVLIKWYNEGEKGYWGATYEQFEDGWHLTGSGDFKVQETIFLNCTKNNRMSSN